MPRVGRKKSESGIYHIILRGINRQTTFEEEEDFLKFLQTLKESKEKGGYKLYGYCLMGNHIHLLLKEENEELGITMRRIGASYVYWYNWKYTRCGHLFQDRYKSETVEDEKYFLTVLRYIHQNPLKAGLVKDVNAYKWSSYPEYFKKNGIVNTGFGLSLFSTDMDKAIESFKAYHQVENSDNCLDIKDTRRYTDNEAREVIKNICGLCHYSEIQTLETDKRNRYLKALKGEGLSTRQLARLTGISRTIILKA